MCVTGPRGFPRNQMLFLALLLCPFANTYHECDRLSIYGFQKKSLSSSRTSSRTSRQTVAVVEVHIEERVGGIGGVAAVAEEGEGEEVAVRDDCDRWKSIIRALGGKRMIPMKQSSSS